VTNPSGIDSPLGSSRARLLPLLVLVIGAAVLLPRLGAYGLWDPTEVKIADAARALGQPHGRGAAPPSLTILMVAEGFKAMGVGEVGGRLPLALLSLLTLLIAYFVGRATLRPRAAFLGALALVTMPSFLFGARQLTSGVPLLLASALSVGGLVYLLWPPKGTNAAVRVLGFAAAAAGIYLGIRSGGVLVGGIAPLTAVLLAYRAARSTRRRLHGENEDLDGLTLIAAILISLAVGLCVVLGYMAWRTHGIHSFWMNGVPHAIQYQTVVTSLLRSLGFATAPWLALIPFALLRSLDGQMPAREDDEADRAVFSRTLWPAVLATTYFTATLQASVVGEMLVPGALAVALLCGAYLDDFLERPALRALEGVAVIMLVMILGHDVLLTTDAFVSVQSLDLIRWPTQVNYTANVLFGIMALFGVLAGGALLMPSVGPLADGARRQRVQRGLLLGAVSVQLVFAGMVVQWLIPTASKHLSPKDLYGKTKQLDPKAALGQYHFNATGASYYMGGRTATPLNTLDELLNFLRRPERVFVFVGSEDLASIDQAARERQVLPPPLNAPPVNPPPANPPPLLKRNAPGTAPPAPLAAKPSGPDASHAAPSVADAPVLPPATIYFVVDDSNSHFLILSNHVGPGERDLNPLRRLLSTTAPKPKTPLGVNFDDKLQFLGYDLPAEAQRGEDVMVRLYFKVLAPVGGSYKIFLHFDGPGARVNGDHVPLDGRFPTQFWTQGTYVTDEYLLKPDHATQPKGLFQLYFGLFSGDKRLKVKEGPSDGENRVRLGTVNVK
jgi:4-amino-4-deoxy-L-arabinose transferase-like glycosyltransferase